MPRSENIILVGGPLTHKTEFHTKFTKSVYETPTKNYICNILTTNGHLIVLIDTPGKKEYRNSKDYSWQGLFQNVKLIVNFGNWTLDEISGIEPSKLPHILTWSGNHDETMKRIIDSLQETQCFQQHGFSSDALWGC